MSIRGLVDSKPGHHPESAHSQKEVGVSWLRIPRQCPLFWKFHGFPLLLTVVGWIFWLFFFSKLHSSSQLSHREHPWGPELLGAPNCSSQQQWCCSGVTLVLHISLRAKRPAERVRGSEATARGGAGLPGHTLQGRSRVSAFPS